MKIKLFPADESACGFYRMMEPARVIEASTADVEIQIIAEADAPGALEVQLVGKINRPVVVGVKDPECDVLVMQRPALRTLVETIPYIQAHGTAVVIENDDDFDTIDRGNPAYAAYDPILSPESNKIWAKLASQLGDLVTVSTRQLTKRYGSHGRCVVLPNCVPESYLKIERSVDMAGLIQLGWAGGVHTHGKDLDMLGDSIPEILMAHPGVEFHAIGDKKIPKAVGLNFDDCRFTDWAPLDKYPHILSTLDVGLVALAHTTFNRSKSWLKGLEFAALGIPFIASTTDEYRKLAELGAGDLVRARIPSTAAWRSAIRKMVEDADYRAERAERGREAAEPWTYEKRAERWLQTWSDALALRRAA